MKSFPTFILILLSISFLAYTCEYKEVPMDKIINIYWIHSHEDDQGDTAVYRSNEYDFPSSRGREGFQFKEGGSFKKFAIAPADGIDTLDGQWKKTETENIFKINIDANEQYGYHEPNDFEIKIVGFDDSLKILKIIHP